MRHAPLRARARIPASAGTTLPVHVSTLTLGIGGASHGPASQPAGVDRARLTSGTRRRSGSGMVGRSSAPPQRGATTGANKYSPRVAAGGARGTSAGGGTATTAAVGGGGGGGGRSAQPTRTPSTSELLARLARMSETGGAAAAAAAARGDGARGHAAQSRGGAVRGHSGNRTARGGNVVRFGSHLAPAPATAATSRGIDAGGRRSSGAGRHRGSRRPPPRSSAAAARQASAAHPRHTRAGKSLAPSSMRWASSGRPGSSSSRSRRNSASSASDVHASGGGGSQGSDSHASGRGASTMTRRGSERQNGHSAFASDPRWCKHEPAAPGASPPTADAAPAQPPRGSPASSTLRLGVGGKAALNFIDIASGSVLNTRSGTAAAAAAPHHHRGPDDAGSRLESARSVATAMSSHVLAAPAHAGAYGATGRISEGVEDNDDGEEEVGTEIHTARTGDSRAGGIASAAATAAGGVGARPHGTGFYGVSTSTRAGLASTAAAPVASARSLHAGRTGVAGSGAGAAAGPTSRAVAGVVDRSAAPVVRDEHIPATPPRHGLRRPVSPIHSPAAAARVGVQTTPSRTKAHVKVLASPAPSTVLSVAGASPVGPWGRDFDGGFGASGFGLPASPEPFDRLQQRLSTQLNMSSTSLRPPPSPAMPPQPPVSGAAAPRTTATASAARPPALAPSASAAGALVRAATSTSTPAATTAEATEAVTTKATAAAERGSSKAKRPPSASRSRPGSARKGKRNAKRNALMSPGTKLHHISMWSDREAGVPARRGDGVLPAKTTLRPSHSAASHHRPHSSASTSRPGSATSSRPGSRGSHGSSKGKHKAGARGRGAATSTGTAQGPGSGRPPLNAKGGKVHAQAQLVVQNSTNSTS